MAKINFDMVYDYLSANGYDETSFCGFLGVPKERYKELEDGGTPDDSEVMAFCECLGIHPGILVDNK